LPGHDAFPPSVAIQAAEPELMNLWLGAAPGAEGLRDLEKTADRRADNIVNGLNRKISAVTKLSPPQL